MDYSEYYKARDVIEKIIRDDLIGPVETEEILHEPPVGYYLLGKIYPRNIKKIGDEQEYVEAEEASFVESDLLALGSGLYPAALGLTFSISSATKAFTVDISVAKYTRLEGEQAWKREAITFSNRFDILKLVEEKITEFTVHDDLVLRILAYTTSASDSINITITLVNNSHAPDPSYRTLSDYTYFQPDMIIHSCEDGGFCDIVKATNTSEDEEENEMQLLYHEYRNYAVGHGCSTSWDTDENGHATSIRMQIIPEYELLQMRPTIGTSEKVLSMKFLSEASENELRKELSSFIDEYLEWINNRVEDIKSLKAYLQNEAIGNIKKCKSTYNRLVSAIELLRNKNVLKAFRYANAAMFYQRKCRAKIDDDSKIKWYPFQIAFFLQELESIVYDKSEYRNHVDLLWFPTGGGKTEAYLGIAAFAIFYRRICALNDGFEDEGVAVIMRYTLRLLSLQQFDRAASMICACEYIRQKEKLGGKAFGIALWAGKDLTPNTLRDAENYLSGNHRGIANPAQIKKCPWCGEQINENCYYTDHQTKKLRIICPNRRCEFHNGLPIFLVDEEIYVHKPSFIIGTVDKYAQLAFQEKAGELLGIDLRRPPDLIIQDELHLISGPLGTITGLYEAAISHLCERNGVKPKVIASTATIRNADNQIRQLYGKDHSIFPPHGISINDSFFAVISDRESKATRKYLGILSAGTSRATTFIRTAGALLFASRYLKFAGFSDEVVDSFWTETGYFNTLRELGSALVRIVDNVQDQYQYLKNEKFKSKYPMVNDERRYNSVYELTSRRSSSELGEIINYLEYTYSSYNYDTPLDFLMASNMISVGVDVSRLNNMIVVGQPMKSSEYIQSTSRVGRKTPGLVMVLYHPTLSRDRSHYESFVQFHSALYKHVEATSITPFSDRARDRALQALYILLCRYSIKQLRANDAAGNYAKDMKELEEIRNYIRGYVEITEPEEVGQVMKEIEDIENEWNNRASHAEKLKYFSLNHSDNYLYAPDYQETDRFRMMNSMRSVEPSVKIVTHN